MLSPRHKAALAYAEAGIPVFPCLPLRKEPATGHGFYDATTNKGQIDEWWSMADYNPAFEPETAGLCVVDVDRSGRDAWRNYCRDADIANDGYAVSTPSGGEHDYFEGSLPSSVRRLVGGAAIDTRGQGGYVLIPPSHLANGYYKVLRNAPCAKLPAAIAATFRKPAPATNPVATEPDDPASIRRVRTFLRNLVDTRNVAIEGSGGDAKTYQIACRIFELGILPNTAYRLLAEEWNPHCLPPWPEDDLQAKIDHAWRYMQNSPGVWANPPAETVFSNVIRLADRMEAKPRGPFHFEDEAEQDAAAEPSWMIPEIFPDMATVLLVGATGSFKSFIAQHMAFSIAAGTKEGPFAAVRSGPVFYGAHEGRRELKKIRRAAWKAANSIDRGIPFYVARAPLVAFEDQCEMFKAEIRARLSEHPPSEKIALIILDTVAKCMVGLNENDAADIGKFVRFCDELRDEFECSVLAIHHLGKDAERGSRGSSALQAGMDTILQMVRTPGTKLVTLKVMQHKDADEREAPWAFEGRRWGNSLAFQPIDAAQVQSQLDAKDPYSRTRIGAALREMKAVGEEQGVSTEALANHLQLALEDRPRLRKAARGRLAGYVAGDGRSMHWFLPEKEDE